MIMKTVAAIVAIWGAFMAVGEVFAMAKTFLIIGLIAAVVVIVVWLVAKRSRRS